MLNSIVTIKNNTERAKEHGNNKKTTQRAKQHRNNKKQHRAR